MTELQLAELCGVDEPKSRVPAVDALACWTWTAEVLGTAPQITSLHDHLTRAATNLPDRRRVVTSAARPPIRCGHQSDS